MDNFYSSIKGKEHGYQRQSELKKSNFFTGLVVAFIGAEPLLYTMRAILELRKS